MALGMKRIITLFCIILRPVPVLNQCPLGFFGQHCNSQCHCKDLYDKDECDAVMGHCRSNQCAVGYKNPPACQTPCEVNQFGYECSLSCHCAEAVECDHVTGQCANNHCGEGYMGPGCQHLLPQLSSAPRLLSKTVSSMEIGWGAWVNGHDSGTGTDDRYLLLKKDTRNDKIDIAETLDRIPGDGTRRIPQYSVLLTSLKPATGYKFAVQIESKHQDHFDKGLIGPWSAEFNTSCVAPVDVPYAVFFATRKIEGNLATLAISWDLPLGLDEACGPIRYINFKVDKCLVRGCGQTVRLQERKSEISRGVVDVDGLPLQTALRITSTFSNSVGQEGPLSIPWFIYEAGKQPGPLPTPVTVTKPIPTQIPILPTPDDKTKEEMKSEGVGMVAVVMILVSSVGTILCAAGMLHFLALRSMKEKFNEQLNGEHAELDHALMVPHSLRQHMIGRRSMPGGPRRESTLIDIEGNNNALDSGLDKRDHAYADVKKIDDKDSRSDPKTAVARVVPVRYPESGLSIQEIEKLMIRRIAANEQLRGEYKTLAPGFLRSTSFAMKHKNTLLNRTSTVLPYDDNRVTLQKDVTVYESAEDDNSFQTNYINASKISLYPSESIIVTQAPLKTTVNHFWQMIWENNIRRIIMLMNFDEPMKLEAVKYWKDGERSTYGPVEVQVKNVKEYAHFAARTIRITHMESRASRDIKHFNFALWSTSGIPAHMVPWVIFMEKSIAASNGATLVHCPNGAGRSGMYLCIESLALKLRDKDQINILATAKLVRNARIRSISTFAQFRFIYEYFSDTQLTNHAISKNEYKLHRFDPISVQKEFNQFESQLGPIGYMTQRGSTVTELEMQSQQKTVPKFQKDAAFSKNVSVASSYKQRDFFVVSPFPFAEHEIQTLLSVAWKNDACILIIFSEEHLFNGLEQRKHGNYTVVPKISAEESPMPFLDVTDFEVFKGNRPVSQKLMIRQYNLAYWSMNGKPPKVDVFLNTFTDIAKWRNDNERLDPIVLVSEERVRSCLFMSFWNSLERLDSDKVVDIYSMTLYSCSQFQGLALNREYYEFLHKVMKKYFKTLTSKGGHVKPKARASSDSSSKRGSTLRNLEQGFVDALPTATIPPMTKSYHENPRTRSAKRKKSREIPVKFDSGRWWLQGTDSSVASGEFSTVSRTGHDWLHYESDNTNTSNVRQKTPTVPIHQHRQKTQTVPIHQHITWQGDNIRAPKIIARCRSIEGNNDDVGNSLDMKEKTKIPMKKKSKIEHCEDKSSTCLIKNGDDLKSAKTDSLHGLHRNFNNVGCVKPDSTRQKNRRNKRRSVSESRVRKERLTAKSVLGSDGLRWNSTNEINVVGGDSRKSVLSTTPPLPPRHRRTTSSPKPAIPALIQINNKNI